MSEVRLGDTLAFPDGDWIAEGLLGGCLRLRNLRTQEVQVVHVTALPQLLAVPPRIAADVSGPRALDMVDDEHASDVAELARHVEEVIYGASRDDGEALPDYSSELPSLSERARRKAAQLTDAGRPVSERTVMRWVTLYRQGGPSALLDRRQFRKSAPLGTLDERLRDSLIAVISRATE
ncbi:helix-turn-helix domain-containing protein [Georgenia sp. SUBG003]|uniref:helix-turn-helix domain-containing protein n=1 Tax=Georgenia sp. SUBG003 TaxID=1497974 RepID=UPI0004D5E8A8|nr:hypothetical protein DA06_25610 [Georgenia sp. SUBG003]